MTRKKRKKISSSKRKTKAKVLRISWISAIIVAAVLLLVLLLPLLRRSNPGTGDVLPKGNFVYGIDISHHNAGPFVWDSLMVMADGRGRTTKSLEDAKTMEPVSFIFIKASEGESMKDSQFRRNWESARQSGIKRGAYHFFRSSKDPAKQASNFMNTVGPLRHSDLPPVLDVETMHRGCSREMLNQRVLRWLSIIGKHYGRTPIVYTSESMARDILSKEVTENYPVWVAHYGVEAPEREKWLYWQCTDRAVVYGIEGYVDLNVMKIK